VIRLTIALIRLGGRLALLTFLVAVLGAAAGHALAR
jgi:hypothetical protein